tara:strand:+ start:3941 stop:5425 length:1485 start_codon:yes stop_codon:yes gene_type:complete
MTNEKIKTRYAPSPTGYLHLGGLRTALYNWLYARANGGEFVIRVEDTDRERHVDASVDQILKSMKLVGMNWDAEPVFQSERHDLYQKHFDKLRDARMVYPAFETMEELEAMRQQAMKEKRPAVYNRAARDMPKDEAQSKIDAGVPHVWRFKTPLDGDTVVNDLLMGGDECRFANGQVGDFAITRPVEKGAPLQFLYNFVVTVDDADMEITHVIRGVEHLGNAAKQVLLYKAWGYEPPKFLHLPLILKGGKKMSKRDTDADSRYPVSVTERHELGYVPEAIANYIALLGWTAADENELMTLEDLKSKFSLDRLGRSNANFDEDKFLHINSWHIRNMPMDQLKKEAAPFLAKAGMSSDDEFFDAAADLVRERCQLMAELPDQLSYFYKTPDSYEDKGVDKFFKTEISENILDTTAVRLSETDDFSAANLEEVLKAIVNDMGLKFGKYGPAIRLALTGRMQSPGLAEVMTILGREESVKRLRAARDYIAENNLMTAA